MRADCLQLLGQQLLPLKKAEGEGTLLPQVSAVAVAVHAEAATHFCWTRNFDPNLQEGAMLGRIEMACERLLARCFEAYYSLSESAPSGILDSGQATTDIPAPALLPAVQLSSARSSFQQICAAVQFCGSHMLSVLASRHSAGRTGAIRPGMAGRALQDRRRASLPSPGCSIR